MRLLNVKTCEVEEIKDDSKFKAALKKCAVISHRWGDHELSFQHYREQIKNSNQKRTFLDPGETSIWREDESEGFLKAARARMKAKDPEPAQRMKTLDYIWMDTCCINKEDSDELQDTINSMFRLYNSAAVCYVHLADVSSKLDGYQDMEKDKQGGIVKPKVGSFEESVWFTRGWTLQELLAPKTVHFFDRYWRFLGTKETLSARIQSATGIDAHYLKGDLSKACIAVKMSWLAGRKTARIEDMAYCMFGLFEISTFIRYGERELAFLRLQQELIKERPLDESIFAWRSPQIKPKMTSCGLLAPWPTCFLESKDLTIDSWKYAPRTPYKLANGGIDFQVPDKLPHYGNGAEWMGLVARVRKNYWLKLNCWEPGVGTRDTVGTRNRIRTRNTVTIHLQKKNGVWRRTDCETWKHRWRPRSSRSIVGPKTHLIQIPQQVKKDGDWGRILAEKAYLGPQISTGGRVGT
ncbi:MAG: hypothetical protein L6R37_001108 [Teloschistes peruensis]|nr:MAG: hypothetical protein L6R37_001108 [Teloschistes peruensis]